MQSSKFIITYLTLVKSGPLTATAGSLITYTLTLTNSGNQTATNLILSDAIPANAVYVDGGAYFGGVVSWTIANLDFAGNNSLTRSFSVRAYQTITNSDYLISADGGVNTAGANSVATLIEGHQPVYLPVILKTP